MCCQYSGLQRVAPRGGATFYPRLADGGGATQNFHSWVSHFHWTEGVSGKDPIRIAHKAFQMEEFDIQFILGNIDFTQGTVAVSGKDKFDLMKNWPNSPFHEYQCNKAGNHFVIAKKHKKVNCASEGCNRWANKNCGHKMCKKCCMELQRKSMKSSACTHAEHRLPKTGLDVTDGDNTVTGE